MSVYAHRGIIIRLLFLTIAVLCALVTGFGRLGRRRVITLCYHGVTGAQQNSFSRQMARVAPHAVDAGDIAHPPAGRFEAPMVCITFDDAFANLLDHAMQHLPRGCRVTMAATSDGDGATLAIADNGPGFPAEVRQRVFERFVKGQGSRGYGLGLALVRATARAHGGEARIMENQGGGARITLFFPSR